MDRATLIRSYQAGDLGFILHSRHQYHWHTGYAPPQTVAAPHIGAVIVAHARAAQTRRCRRSSTSASGSTSARRRRAQGVPHRRVPRQRVRAVPDSRAGGGGGSVSPAEGDEPGAVREPRRVLQEDARAVSPVGEFGSDYQKESLLRSMDNAHRLLTSPAAKAFDLSLEPKESYDKYNTGRFGLGCLLARRLVEAGARFIEVTTRVHPVQVLGHARQRPRRGWST